MVAWTRVIAVEVVRSSCLLIFKGGVMDFLIDGCMVLIYWFSLIEEKRGKIMPRVLS